MIGLLWAWVCCWLALVRGLLLAGARSADGMCSSGRELLLASSGVWVAAGWCEECRWAVQRVLMWLRAAGLDQRWLVDRNTFTLVRAVIQVDATGVNDPHHHLAFEVRMLGVLTCFDYY
ncbi:hypothetical protein SO802_025701 [Lithocarpus litseifolius]|uniref:Secreted protein n=1 Tax=Lithocarpus litseifolius TaxID=425828 RepID=A0AAW2BZB8_9ROSI